MPDLVSEAEALDAEWLTKALREAGLLRTGRVASVQHTPIGTGKMGDNVRYELSYEGANADLPASFVAKLPATDPVARATSAAQGSYWREVSFYREVAPSAAIRTPKAYTALVGDNRSDYVILMEDMTPAEPGDQIAGCSTAVAEVALREAAKLHGPLCESDRIRNAEWVVPMTEDGAALGQAMLGGMWPGFVDRFGGAMSPEGVSLGQRFVDNFKDFALAYDGPRTLVHADYRLENMLFGNERGGPPITVVDWQSCSFGCGLADIAYFLGGGLSIDDRRAHEQELVEMYRRELSTYGVDLSAEDCWMQYRRSALHGIFITIFGSMLSGQDDRGDRMFNAMIERHSQHTLDMECGDFL